jgi:23S rRNA pseudouridine1911/1915/1917 synthase
MGDRTYGGPRAAKIGDLTVERQMLHAETLSLLHPDTGTPLSFTAPPPKDMAEVIEALRKRKAG